MIRKFEIFLELAVSLLLLSACAHSSSKVEGLEPTPEQKAADRAELDAAWKQYENGDSEKSLAAFRAYRTQHPQTIYDNEALIGEARALTGTGDLGSASLLDHQIIQDNLTKQPKLAALAMFDLATVAEALGNDSEMLASLQDAEKHQNLLPDSIRLAQLPARLAVAFTKVRQIEEARRYRALADQGIEQLKHKGMSPDEWAKLYLDMGTVSTAGVSQENFQMNLDSFSSVQIFLLKSLEAGAKPWSDRALTAVQEHYRDFWNFATNPPVPGALDAGAKQRMRSDMESNFLGAIAKAVAILKQNYKPEGSPVSEQEGKLREFVTALEAQLRERMFTSDSANPLTPEAQKRQSLKKKGTVISAPLFPSEKKNPSAKIPPAPAPGEAPPALPPKATPAPQDPNLKSGDAP